MTTSIAQRSAFTPSTNGRSRYGWIRAPRSSPSHRPPRLLLSRRPRRNLQLSCKPTRLGQFRRRRQSKPPGTPDPPGSRSAREAGDLHNAASATRATARRTGKAGRSPAGELTAISRMPDRQSTAFVASIARRTRHLPTKKNWPHDCTFNSCKRQASSISTAIRTRSEWFFAPSFCLSRDVVLATVL